jgi:hypothetical protein
MKNCLGQALLEIVKEAIRDETDDSVFDYLAKNFGKEPTMPQLIEVSKNVVKVVSGRREGIIKPNRDQNRKEVLLRAWFRSAWREHKECFDQVLRMMIGPDGSVSEAHPEEVKAPFPEEMASESCASSSREELLAEDGNTPYAEQVSSENGDVTSTEEENIFIRYLPTSYFEAYCLDDFFGLPEERNFG